MSPSLDLISLDDRTLQLQSRLWATNSVIVSAGGACLVCDPSIFPDEIEEIAVRARRHGRAYVLVTHSDFDHVCGVPAFDPGTVIAGVGTAAAVADGTARRNLDLNAPGWGTAWDGDLRVDTVPSDDPIRCGGLSVAAIDARGHIADGSALVVAECRLLLPGDYLSAVCHPVVLCSLADAIATNRRLLKAIEDYDISLVVPGHGPALNRTEAQRIARQDIDYIRALQDAAGQTVARRASANDALTAASAVRPPRETRPDLEAFGLRAATARTALAEAGHPAFDRAA
jgi:glyoxylase-like metal-dependent hydrolase (beta-lactamase superfamily II)